MQTRFIESLLVGLWFDFEFCLQKYNIGQKPGRDTITGPYLHVKTLCLLEKEKRKKETRRRKV